jgi:hypothetical protein
MNKAMDILRKPWVLVLLAAAVIYLLIKWKGGALFNVFNPAPLPNTSNVGVTLTDEQRAQVRSMSQRLHEEMSGLNVFKDVVLWQEYMGMGDPMFIAVYNDFGNLYYAEGNGTLRQWVADEAPWWNDFAGRDDILDRFARLNLQ